MRFDYAVGNPPYQGDTVNKNKSYVPTVYYRYLDQVHDIARKSVLIHPAKFLFDGGATPKDWNKRMLSDVHLKVVQYWEHNDEVFPDVEIRGGIAVTYYDSDNTFEPITVFTKHPTLRDILKKVSTRTDESIRKIVFHNSTYSFTKQMKLENPSAVHAPRTNIFVQNEEMFYEEKPSDDQEYTEMYGIINLKRVRRWILKRYLNGPRNWDAYKVFVSKSNGHGDLGEALAPLIIASPGQAHTRSFMSIGCFDTEREAIALSKYIKSKFLRALLSIRKVTQENATFTWEFIPMQDFSSGSDIDWEREVDPQLYKKYGLSVEEIDFIETHIREMV